MKHTLIAALLLAPLALAQVCDPGKGELKKGTAAEAVVFQPEYASGPADNPLKGFVPYAGQGRDFPHSLEFDYLSLASLMRKAGAMERWRTAPIGGEIRPELWPCLWRKEGCKEGENFARCVRETHASWLMESSTSRALTPDERERALAAAQSLGYELQIVKATAVLEGRALEVSVAITNRGVAPFYAAWPVRLLALGSDGSESGAELPFVLKTLQPAATDTRSVTLNLAKFASGETKLLIGIPNPLTGGKPLRFANVGKDRDRAGWLTLGKLVIP